MWIFGYGSLVWKVDFSYKRKVVGFIKGYSRRFWQASIDHRGVPGNPGRVVTLIPSDNSEEKVWGVAYEIAPEDVEFVRNHLDYRERGGYERKVVTFHPEDGKASFPLEIYLGTTDNPFFIGPCTVQEVAEIIVKAVGPSGANTEYLFGLARALRELGPEAGDCHVFELEAEVLKLNSMN